MKCFKDLHYYLSLLYLLVLTDEQNQEMSRIADEDAVWNVCPSCKFYYPV